MKKGFDLSEAQEMLGLAYAADLLGPAGFKREEVENWTKEYSQDLANPLLKDDGTYFPYPDKQVWPDGWTPGLPAKKGAKSPWDDSVIVPMPFRGALQGLLKALFQGKQEDGTIRSFLSDKMATALARQFELTWLGANNVVITYNKKRNAYAIGFAGTQNQLGQYQDLIFTPVSARELTLGPFKSNTSYVYEPLNTGEQIGCSIHLGFRLALEQFTVNAAKGDSLKEVLVQLNRSGKGKDRKGRLQLYIAGHSLGAAMGSIFTAWLQANQEKFIKENKHFPRLNLKMYVFATPKTGNDGFCKSFDMGLTNQGMAFHVDNHLDAVPEIPLSLQTLYSLGNLEMLTSMGGASTEEEVEENTTDTEEAEKEIAALEAEDSDSARSKILAIIGKQVLKVAKGAVNIGNWMAKGPVKDSNYRHIGHQVIVRGPFPRTRKTNVVEAEFYPGDHTAKPTDIAPPNIVASWWHHWPWVYRKALDEMFKEEA